MATDQKRAERLRGFEVMEREHALFDYRVDGWSAWRVLRFPVHLTMLGLPMALQTRPQWIRILEALRATPRYLWLLATAGRLDLFVKTCRTALRLRLGDKFRDVYFDALIERGYSALKLEEINSPNFEAQAAAAWRPSDLNPIVFTFWGRVLGKLFPVDAGEFCKKVSDLLRQYADTSIEPGWLLAQLSSLYWQIRLYSLLLRRVRPRAAFIADTGEYALRIAAKRNGIPLVEMQHGVFDNDHPDAVPLWATGTPAELVLPDILACYGDYWIERLEGTHQGATCAIPVGNQLIENARQRRRKRGPTAARHLVLTSQGIDTVRLAQWVADMVAAAPSGLDWRLSIKLHPAFDVTAGAFSILRSERVAIIGGAAEPNVYDLLADADMHLSIASACHFDAAALAVPTVIIPLAGHEPMLKLVDGEQFFLASRPAEVWSLTNTKEPDLARSHAFAAPGFADNLEKILPSKAATAALLSHDLGLAGKATRGQR